MAPLVQSVRPLFDPVDGTPGAVEARRWAWPALFLMAAMSLSSVATFFRYDAAPRVVGALKAEDLAKLSEQDLEDQIATARRLSLVTGLARALLGVPVLLPLLALALKLGGWLWGARAPFRACVSTAAVALLPLSVYHLVYAGVAARQFAIVDRQLGGLVPSSLAALVQPPEARLAQVLGVVDFFNLWSAVLLGLGFAAASGMRRPRAIALGLWLYLLYAGIFQVGLPGMTGGGPG